MIVNRRKQFENVIRKSFECVEGVSIDRLNDNTAGFKGVAGICDFIVYKKPHEYYIECKSVHGNTLPFANVTETQWNGLLEKSKIVGVRAGIMCWWIDRDVTRFIPIEYLDWLRRLGKKSIRFDNEVGIRIYGKKKRVFWDYEMGVMFDD